MESLAMTQNGFAVFLGILAVAAAFGIASAEFDMWRARRQKQRQNGV